MADFDTNIVHIRGIYKLFMPCFDTIKAFIRVIDSSQVTERAAFLLVLLIAVRSRKIILNHSGGSRIKKDLVQQLSIVISSVVSTVFRNYIAKGRPFCTSYDMKKDHLF